MMAIILAGLLSKPDGAYPGPSLPRAVELARDAVATLAHTLP